MEDDLRKKLKAGIEEEIQYYESMLKISCSEQEILKKEAYSRELIDLASEKLQLMNQIHQIGLMLAPLKVMWLKERENKKETSDEDEIDPVIGHLSKVLEELLDVDRSNTLKLAEMTGSIPEEEKPAPEIVGNIHSAAQAYRELSTK